MNFDELQDRVGFVLNFNDGQADQDFTAARIKQAINYAYNREIQKAMLEGSRRFFRATQDVTWAASSVTLTLPAGVAKKALIRIADVTSDAIGAQLLFSENGLTGDVFFKDRSTLQWGTSGPSSAKTLRFVYYETPLDMIDDDDEPDIMPEAFHELLVWSAAIWLRTVGDESAPTEWRRELMELQIDFYKHVSLGRPQDDEPTVRLRDSDLTDA